MINPNQKDVRNALEIVQTGNIARAHEIIKAIKEQNKLIQEDILAINFAKEGEDISGFHQGIFDTSIVVQDLVNCLTKLINDFTGAPNANPKFEWKSLK